MYGFDAISANNGWFIAATGVSMVFIGLIVLTLIISQLHNVLALMEKLTAKPEVIPETKPTIRVPPPDPSDVETTARVFTPLIEELPSEFQLSELYALAKEYHLPHPHLSIRCLIENGTLQPLGEGVFIFIPSCEE
ncbi:OadG family protein [Desulfobulbus alkaliphilus]|uniref:OadG family protein n=1 Tax=Desulfobulbus alkaliphilus TaxID=869814 RepID=UPI0019633FC8|nr:OadG family protein [Desulfobulbus alkaliphilus]MBM9536904.1 OadG family protein [Desulfobulbus alkaliphilus]